VTPAQLRRLCLALSDAEETFPFGPETSVFKVGGKMFALAQLKRKPLQVSVNASRNSASSCAVPTTRSSPATI
jgi:predicted DNA-binding protein (MmcQ/YjbR family)